MGLFSFSISWLVCFPDFKAVFGKSSYPCHGGFYHLNLGTPGWERSGSGRSNTSTELFLHQDIVSLVVMYFIWAVPQSPSG